MEKWGPWLLIIGSILVIGIVAWACGDFPVINK